MNKPTETKPTNNSKSDNGSFKLTITTILMFALIVIAVLAGGELVGILHLPNRVLPYIGGAMLGYVIVGTYVVTHICAKSMLNKKG